MSRKILFLDIDGTLWDFHSFIPDSTVEAIRLARKNGHLAFINTGRARAFVFDKNLLDIGFDGVVSGCGTMVEYNGEVKFYHRLDRKLATRTVETVRKFAFRPILEGRYNLYMDNEEFKGDPYGDKLIVELKDRLLPIADNWGEWEISKLSCATSENRHEECMEALKDDFTFMVHSSEVVEMTPVGFDKGVGIKKVCELLGADIEDTIAFGDSVNDTAMLETAGTSVVMGNGDDRVKKIASFVTDDLRDDGIYNACKKLGLI